MQPAVTFADKPTGATLVRCAAGKIGGQPGGGVIGRQDVGIAGKDSAAISYRVMFEAGAEWGKSGKLPGIYAGSITDFAPDRPPNGVNGCTIRPLWRADGGVKLYVWDMRPQGYGREYASLARWPAGRFADVRLAVTLNTPGHADGVIVLTIDGKDAVRVTDLMARSTANMKLTGCFWCVFYGGGTLDYAPTREQRIVVTDVVSA